LFFATPEIRLPSSKMRMERRKADFMGKYPDALPHVLWKAARVRKKGRAIPSYLVQGVKLVSNTGDGCRDNGSVESNEEHCENKSEYDEN